MANSIYAKPVKELFRDLIEDLNVNPGSTITRKQILDWFNRKYPLIKDGTVLAHLVLFTTNSRSRTNHNVDPSGKHDVFYQIDKSNFRAYRRGEDPKPIYKPSGDGGKTRPQQGRSDPPSKPELPLSSMDVPSVKPLELVAKEVVLNLEEILEELDARAGRELFQWIQDLEQQKRIPRPVVDMMHTIRKIRNNVVHSNHQFNEHDRAVLKSAWLSVMEWWKERSREKNRGRLV